jgi:N-acetylneuraminic acid mutarotase
MSRTAISSVYFGSEDLASRCRIAATIGVLALSLLPAQGAVPLTGASSPKSTVVIDATAESIFYQGRLTDSGSLASGTYDFQFLLKDAATGGNTVGEALKLSLPVQSGVFSASLPWSSSLFSGAARWIEVQVRPAPATGSSTAESEAPYAVLERQRILSTPYAFRSLTAATVESVPVQSLPASVPLIGSGGKLDSGLLGADIARSAEVEAKVASLAKEDVAIKGSVKALEDANTARMAENASLSANLQNLQAKWTASQEAVDAKLAALTAENAALKQSVQVIGAPARSGWMVASLQAEDPELVSAGFSLVSSTPAASWVPTASVGAPSARSSSASVWTGQEWIIWGGSVASQNPVATGARYRPDTDTWSDLTSVDAPKARKGHTAVWTGSQMIVWGGFNENNLNTGGRFTPYPQSWASMSTEDAPSARTGHGAVWTGKTMVIFGGRNSGGLLSDGGVYDPALDRWTALPTEGAPNARHLASVVWTGKALLVWGGELADEDANSGALLSFDLDGKPLAWSPLPVLDGFAGRSGHASVWDGQRLIVWGGRHRSGTVLADGALWDSTTSKWTYLEAAGAPPARLDASAVWTGDELVVFGGSGNQGPLSSGAAWSLSTRKWRTLPSQSSTGARNGALAAWTGSHLLIFGGLSSSSIAMADPQKIDIRPPWYLYRRGALPAESLPISSP